MRTIPKGEPPMDPEMETNHRLRRYSSKVNYSVEHTLYCKKGWRCCPRFASNLCLFIPLHNPGF